MRQSISRLLVAYDIADDARRDRVAVALQAYGERVQFSIFLVDGKPADFVRLRATLRRLIDPDADRVLLCNLGSLEAARSRAIYLGRPPRLTGDAPHLIL